MARPKKKVTKGSNKKRVTKGKATKESNKKRVTKKKKVAPGKMNLKVFEEPEDYVMPKTYKFLGWCPKRSCNCMISTKDLVPGKKTIYLCPSCNKRDRISRLRTESNIQRAKSKKDFLSQSNSLYVKNKDDL